MRLSWLAWMPVMSTFTTLLSWYIHCVSVLATLTLPGWSAMNNMQSFNPLDPVATQTEIGHPYEHCDNF